MMGLCKGIASALLMIAVLAFCGACSSSATAQVQSSPWPYTTDQLTTGEVVAASAGRNGQVSWSSGGASNAGATLVEANVQRDDGKNPPQQLRFQWSVNAAGHVSLVGYSEDGQAKPVIALMAEVMAWRLE